jgi:glycosyltransferase involved in cell wall biosynthesis
MIHELYGAGGFALRQAKRLSIGRAAVIITPSRATASDLKQIYPRTRAEILTIPWGISARFTTAARSTDAGIDLPFILYLGPRSGYKNFAVLLRALTTAPDLGEHRLVLVGGEPLRESEKAGIVEALGSSGRLVHLRQPTDDTLRALYDHASVLVVTSRREGFGLPLLEAMARGCPAAYAEGGSSSELAGSHAAVFSPDSPAGCAEAIREAIASTVAQRQAAEVHARAFEWSATVEGHVAAYEAAYATRR